MFKIGELARITGISIQTIRFYEAEGLISPIEVDRWTNYRYYDQSSIVRLSEIAYLKELGFSLSEIKNLSEETINEKVLEIKENIKKLTKNIHKLSSIQKKKGEFVMKNFVNDERVIGKWKKIAVIKEKEDFKLNKIIDEEIFMFPEIYFLPDGKEYWVFGWTNGALFVNNRKMPYEIIDNKLYIGITDRITEEVENYAVYEKVDSNHYDISEIEIKDNIEIPFINDEKAIGFWEVIDVVNKKSDFNPKQKFWKYDMFLKKYIFEPNGKLVAFFGEKGISQLDWSKNVVINKNNNTASEYEIINIDGQDYMIMEWKSGDYVYGGKINCYYLFKKIK